MIKRELIIYKAIKDALYNELGIITTAEQIQKNL